MPSSPIKALNFPKTKFGFSLHALLGLGCGVIIGLGLHLYLGVHFALAGLLGVGIGIAAGLTIGTGTQRFFRALYKPRKYYLEVLPNQRTQWRVKKKKKFLLW